MRPISIEAIKNHCSSIAKTKQAHALLLRTHLFFNNRFTSKLIDFLAISESGSLSYARKIFPQIHDPDSYIWNTIIRGYARSQNPHEALAFYYFMVVSGFRPDNYTYPFVVGACGRLQQLEMGRRFHSEILRKGFGSDLFVVNSLILFYGNCGSMKCACKVFDGTPVRDVVTWNLMINAYIGTRLYRQSFDLFEDMMNLDDIKPDETTIISLVSACTHLSDLERGDLLCSYSREFGLDKNLNVSNAILDMYCKCGDLESAKLMFNSMPERDVFSYTSILSGLADLGYYQESLALFRKVQFEKIQPDEIMLVKVLSACAQAGALDEGKYIHLLIYRFKINCDVVLGTALVDMYAKCGALHLALQVFEKMRTRNVFTWNAMIGGLAIHGHGEEAIMLFDQMKGSKVVPDDVTFIALLGACSHVGLVDEGLEIFKTMKESFQIEPRLEHYGCVVDLLCRARLVDDALAFLENMPLKANSVLWATLLGACRTGGHFELAERVGKRVIELEPDSCGRYVMISNLYAGKNQWDNALGLRKQMKNKGIEKTPGCSWIEFNGQIHQFVAGDRTHIETENIYTMLEEITQRIHLDGGHEANIYEKCHI